MADTILGAIVGRFDTSLAYQEVVASGGLWFAEIPSDNIYPYAVLWHLGETCDYTTEADYVERGKIQFEVYATDLRSAETIALKIKDEFDPRQDNEGNTKYVPLLIDGAKLQRFERTNYLALSMRDQAPDSKTVYQVIVEYSYEVKRDAKIK